MSTTSYAQFSKVKLVASTDPASKVIFNVAPEISESSSSNYSTLSPVHLPGTIYIYTGSSSRTFRLTVKFISRTMLEATQNHAYIELLRGWQKNYFGQSSTLSSRQRQLRRVRATDPAKYNALKQQWSEKYGSNQLDQYINARLGQELLGAPPDVLYFSAYAYTDNNGSTSSAVRPYTTNIDRIPVVLGSFNTTFPTDVDYIPTADNIPQPLVQTVSIDLMETHSPSDYMKFNLTDYKQGILPGF